MQKLQPLNFKLMIGGWLLFWLFFFPAFCVFFVLINVATFVVNQKRDMKVANNP